MQAGQSNKQPPLLAWKGGLHIYVGDDQTGEEGIIFICLVSHMFRHTGSILSFIHLENQLHHRSQAQTSVYESCRRCSISIQSSRYLGQPEFF